MHARDILQIAGVSLMRGLGDRRVVGGLALATIERAGWH